MHFSPSRGDAVDLVAERAAVGAGRRRGEGDHDDRVVALGGVVEVGQLGVALGDPEVVDAVDPVADVERPGVRAAHAFQLATTAGRRGAGARRRAVGRCLGGGRCGVGRWFGGRRRVSGGLRPGGLRVCRFRVVVAAGSDDEREADKQGTDATYA